MDDREAGDVANRLTAHLGDQACSVEGNARWHAVMLDALRRVRHHLPPVASDLVARAPASQPLTFEETGAERTALWESIRGDRLGDTASGAATRATLFLFYPFDESSQDGTPFLFTWFYCLAGLPVEALEAAVHAQWPGASETKR
jgi:hypothetical protein